MRLKKRMTVSASVMGLLFCLVTPTTAQTRLPNQWQSLPPDQITAIVTDQLRGDKSTDANLARKRVIDHLVQQAQSKRSLQGKAQQLPHLIRLAADMPPDQQQWLRGTIFQALDADAVFKPGQLNKDFYYAKRLVAALKTLKADTQLIQNKDPVGQMILTQQDTLPPKFTLTDTTSGSFHGYTESYRRYHRHPAVAQCDAETIQWLRNKLAASSDVHPTAVIILSWRYRDDGPLALADWRAFLDSQITRSGLTGNQRAGWLLARAYFEEVDGPSITPLEGQAWVEQALVIAGSPTIRLDCLRWLALGHAARNHFQDARDVLAKHQTQFAATGAGTLLTNWRRQINAAERGQAKIQVIADARGEMQLTRARLEYLQERLDKARRQGEPMADIQKMEAVVTRLVSRKRELRDGIRNRSARQAP